MSAPILTNCGTPPRAGSMAFLRWVDRCFDWCYTQCPLARTTTYYIKQGTNNSNTGLDPDSVGADGPRNCNTFTDLKTFINANQGSGNVRFRLDQSATWRSVAATATDEIVISQPNVTIDSYNAAAGTGLKTGPATARAKLIAGSDLGSGGWTNDLTYTNLWYKATSTANFGYLTWTTDRAEQHADFRRLTNPFRYYAPNALASLTATLTAMNTTAEDAFVFDTTNNRVYVRSTAGSFNSSIYLDMIHKTNDCIQIGSNSSTTVTGCRIDNLHFIGWGMSSPTNQGYSVHIDCAGDTINSVTNCTHHFGAFHMMTLNGTDTVTDGGSAMFDNIELAYGGKNGTGGGTMLNCNSPSTTDQEVICRNIRGRAGALKGWSSSTTPSEGTISLIYSHTTGGSDVFKLMMSVGCGIDEGAVDPSGGRFSLGANSGNIDTTGMDAAYLDTTKYRLFEIGSTSWANHFDHSNGSPKLMINCYHSIQDHPIANYSCIGGSNSTAQRAIWINSILDIKDLGTSNTSSTEYYFVNPNATSTIHMVNSLWVNRPFFQKTYFMNLGTHSYLSGSRIYNSGVLSQNRLSTSATITNPINQAPSSSQGGCAGLIVGPNSQVSTSGNNIGYDSTSNPIFITSVPSEPFRLVGLMSDLADQAEAVNVPELRVDYDMFFRQRGADAGPSGGSGITGNLGGGSGNNLWLTSRK